MKNLIQLSLLLAAALMLGACSTINSRINQNAALYNSLDPTSQTKISHGDIDLGFTPAMVYMALGAPDVKRQRVAADGQTETWIYRTYYDAYDGFGYMGYHRWFAPYGRFYRVYWEPAYIGYPVAAEDNIRVTFKNGRVVMIDQARA